MNLSRLDIDKLSQAARGAGGPNNGTAAMPGSQFGIEARRLINAGYLEERDCDVPNIKIYRLTHKGLDALHAWGDRK